jgi:hypothetical protein
MRSISSVLLLLFVLVAVPLLGQSQLPRPTSQPDGGVRETLESIAIPPMANALFVATLQREWVRTTNLSLTDPDAKLFKLPEGFRVLDERSPRTKAAR